MKWPCPFCPFALPSLDDLGDHVHDEHDGRKRDVEAFATTERNQQRLTLLAARE